MGINSAPPSTRPASVYSDGPLYSMPRPLLRSVDTDTRSIMSDDRSSFRRGSVYNVFQNKLNPQLLPAELASSIGSYGRSSTATTTASDIFSSASQSVTSASVYSRAPSILYGSLPDFGRRPLSSVKEKKRFRETLRKGLVCLLLSDLGGLVWSWGCETDKWISDVQSNSNVQSQIVRNSARKALFNTEQYRRRSMSETEKSTQDQKFEMSIEAEPKGSIESDANLPYLIALEDILLRMRKQVDPAGKLQACIDFHAVALDQLRHKWITPKRAGYPKSRRRSFGPPSGVQQESARKDDASVNSEADFQPNERQIIDHLKKQLTILKPTTLFRDLQFTAVFSPPEMLGKDGLGQTFMCIGMAALEYKNELCGIIIDIADQNMSSNIAKDGSPPQSNSALATSAEYWRIAALEGNRVAQRELALLYLMRPDVLPVSTLPLAISADIFQEDMMWERQPQGKENRQALCLALHWMQQAAKNGDEIASKKLAERQHQEQDVKLSIR